MGKRAREHKLGTPTGREHGKPESRSWGKRVRGQGKLGKQGEGGKLEWGAV